MQAFKQPDEAFLRQMIDALPLAALVVDNDVRIQFANRMAVNYAVPGVAEPILKKRGGDALGCIHAEESPQGCGHSEACKDCVMRNSVNASFRGQSITRRRIFYELLRGEKTIEVPFLVTTSPFDFRDRHFCLLLLEDISELVNLQDMLPICASCKKIRDDQNYWHHVEKYMTDHVSDIAFTHSLCPECLEKLYPGRDRRHKRPERSPHPHV